MYLLERIFALIALMKAAILTVGWLLSIEPGGSSREVDGGDGSTGCWRGAKMMLDWKFGGRYRGKLSGAGCRGLAPLVLAGQADQISSASIPIGAPQLRNTVRFS